MQLGQWLDGIRETHRGTGKPFKEYGDMMITIQLTAAGGCKVEYL